MSLTIASLASVLLALGNSGIAQDTSEPWQPPASDTLVADAQGLCNTKASENIFVQFDAKAWRNEFRTNCWWPAFESRSRYFIKTYDWGSAPPGAIIAADGITRPPVDIWVQGLHQNDVSVPYRKSLTLYRVACGRGVNRVAPVQFIAYDAVGKVIDEWERSDVRMRAAIPDSKEEAFAAAVCT